MYVLALDGLVEKFPYTMEDLQAAYPNTSFPRNIDPETLAEYNVFPVVYTSKPDCNPETQYIYLHGCIYNAELTRWETLWAVGQFTPEEITEIRDSKWAEVRSQRDRLLSESDWTQLPDSPADKPAWAAYRQDLRNVTSQEDPFNIVWPTPPQA